MAEQMPDEEGNERPPEELKHQQVAARVPEHVGRGVFSTGALVMTGGSEFILDFVLRMMRPHQIVARVVIPHRVMPQLIQVLRDNVQKYENRFGPIVDLNTLQNQAQQASQEETSGEADPPQEPTPGGQSQDEPGGAGAPAGGGADGGSAAAGAASAAEQAGDPERREERANPGGSPQANRPSVEEIYDDLKLPDELLSGVYANAVMISHSAAEFNLDFLTNFYPRSAVSCRLLMAAPHVPPLLSSLENTWRHLQRRIQQQNRQQPPEE